MSQNSTTTWEDAIQLLTTDHAEEHMFRQVVAGAVATVMDKARDALRRD